MRTILLALCLLVATPAIAQDLRGQWNITAAHRPDYVGVVMIDSERRATWDAVVDEGRPAKFRGYVSRQDGPKVELLFTDGTQVVQAHCTMQSGDLWHCQNIRHDKSLSDPYLLTRVGPGPHRLIPPR